MNNPRGMVGVAKGKLVLLGEYQRGEPPERTEARNHWRAVLSEATAELVARGEERLPYKDGDDD